MRVSAQGVRVSPAAGEYWLGEGRAYAGVMPDCWATSAPDFSTDEAVGATRGACGVSERGATSGLKRSKHRLASQVAASAAGRPRAGAA